MMPGGDADAYKFIEPIVTKVAAQVTRFSCAVMLTVGLHWKGCCK